MCDKGPLEKLVKSVDGKQSGYDLGQCFWQTVIVFGYFIAECWRPSGHAEPHTHRTHAFIFVRSSSSAVNGSRARTHNDGDDVAQHGAHTGELYTHYIHLCSLTLEIHFMVNWQLSNQGIRWPVPLTISRAQVGTHLGKVFFLSWSLTRLWIFIESRAQVFAQIIRTSQTTGAPLLDLDKSIYYTIVFILQNLGGNLRIPLPHLFKNWSISWLQFSQAILKWATCDQNQRYRKLPLISPSGYSPSVC